MYALLYALMYALMYALLFRPAEGPGEMVALGRANLDLENFASGTPGRPRRAVVHPGVLHLGPSTTHIGHPGVRGRARHACRW